jgi:RNA polymerase sigma factor (sigma-70 family)
MIEDVLLVIDGCLKGEGRAWNLFVKEFGSVADNILKKFSDIARSNRENIIQNVFIKLLKGGLSNFRGTTKYEFLKYFKTIVINEGISYLKLEGRGKEQVSLNGKDSEGISLKDLISDEDSHSRPDLTTEEKEALNSIRKVVEVFPLIDQEIFWMKFRGDKDEEIRKILKVPLGTVASKYSRMIDKLKKELRER